jgi:uncharacterized protein YndB with AHSA1/START domain
MTMSDTHDSHDTDADLGEVTFTYIYKAPIDLVFRCMTQPEHLCRFWGPTGMTTPIENIVVEPRVGGAFETVMVNEESGEEYPMRAVYTTFEPPARLGWGEPGVPGGGMNTLVSFTDLGDGRTEALIHQTNVPAMFRSEEAQAGMRTSFDKGAAYMEALAAA